MGKGNGVEVREKSIRLIFSLNGARVARTLKVGGKPMAPTAPNIAFAERTAAEIRERIRHGTFSLAEFFPQDAVATVGRGGTVHAHLTSWLATLRVEHSTMRGYKAAVNFWAARIGATRLRDLKPSHIMTAIASRPDLKGKTINNYMTALRDAMQLAVVDRLVHENPVVHVATAKAQRPVADPFSMDEVEAIVADLHKRAPAQAANLIEFKFFSGLRSSEVFGLQWGDVGLAKGEVLVHQALVNGRQKSNTKTNVARRVLLNSRALAALQRQRQHTQAGAGAVFLDPVHLAPWEMPKRLVRLYWAPCLRRLGIRYRQPYATRHSYATMMLMAGAAPAWCAKQLGHSVDVFLRTYAKWLDGEHDDIEMAGLEKFIARKTA